MGEPKLLYLSDEALELLKGQANMSSFVDGLILKEFSTDEEVLRERVIRDERELNRMKALLQDKVEQRLRRQTKERERQSKNLGNEANKKIMDKFVELWQSDKVTDDQYWSCFPNNEAPLYTKMEEIIKEKEANKA